LKKLFGRNYDGMGNISGFLQLFMLFGGVCWCEVSMFQSKLDHQQREKSSVLGWN